MFFTTLPSLGVPPQITEKLVHPLFIFFFLKNYNLVLPLQAAAMLNKKFKKKTEIKGGAMSFERREEISQYDKLDYSTMSYLEKYFLSGS